MVKIDTHIVKIVFRGGHLGKWYFGCLKQKIETDIHPSLNYDYIEGCFKVDVCL